MEVPLLGDKANFQQAPTIGGCNEPIRSRIGSVIFTSVNEHQPGHIRKTLMNLWLTYVVLCGQLCFHII